MQGGRRPCSTPARTSSAMRSSVVAASAEPSIRRAGMGPPGLHRGGTQAVDATAGTPRWSSPPSPVVVPTVPRRPFSKRSGNAAMIDAAGPPADPTRGAAMPAAGEQPVLHLDGAEGPVTATVAELAAGLRRVRVGDTEI